MGVLQDIESGNFSQLFSDIKKSWEGSSIGTIIDNAGAAAWTELQTVVPAALEGAAASTAATVLSGISAGNSTSAIISAGITEAESAFATAGKQVAATTLTTFVSAVHNQVVATQAAANPVIQTP